MPRPLQSGEPRAFSPPANHWQALEQVHAALMGELAAYVRENYENLLDGEVGITLPGFQLRERVWIGEGVELSPDGIGHYDVVVAKLAAMHAREPGLTGANLREITPRTLVMVGDDDEVRLEHAIEMYRSLPTANSPSFPVPRMAC